MIIHVSTQSSPILNQSAPAEKNWVFGAGILNGIIIKTINASEINPNHNLTHYLKLDPIFL